MKKIFLLLCIYLNPIVIFSQSIIIPEGSSIYLPPGSDICAGEIGNIEGTILGEGTQCEMQYNFTALLNVYDKWNLISFPGYHPNSMAVDTLYRFRDLSANVFNFNGSGYVSVNSLETSKGYWLKHNGIKSYNWNGSVQNGVFYPKIIKARIDSIDVTTGWNLIGVFEYSILPGDLTTSPSGITSVFPYKFVPGLGYQFASVLNPGDGYFIKFSNPGKLIYPARQSFIKNNSDSPINPDWATINVLDNVGSNYKLYLTNGTEKLDAYELPPKPPIGLFDVRFSSDKLVEHSVSELVFEISGAVYPIKIKASGISFKLSDEITKKVISESVYDGEEVIIDDQTLSKFNIKMLETLPMTFALEQNYPNPFNPSTTIKYKLAETEKVTLKVFDILGNEVIVLINETQNQGRYNVEFSSEGLASGVYLYRIQAGDFVDTKKMILLK